MRQGLKAFRYGQGLALLGFVVPLFPQWRHGSLRGFSGQGYCDTLVGGLLDFILFMLVNVCIFALEIASLDVGNAERPTWGCDFLFRFIYLDVVVEIATFQELNGNAQMLLFAVQDYQTLEIEVSQNV